MLLLMEVVGAACTSVMPHGIQPVQVSWQFYSSKDALLCPVIEHLCVEQANPSALVTTETVPEIRLLLSSTYGRSHNAVAHSDAIRCCGRIRVASVAVQSPKRLGLARLGVAWRIRIPCDNALH